MYRGINHSYRNCEGGIFSNNVSLIGNMQWQCYVLPKLWNDPTVPTVILPVALGSKHRRAWQFKTSIPRAFNKLTFIVKHVKSSSTSMHFYTLHPFLFLFLRGASCSTRYGIALLHWFNRYGWVPNSNLANLVIFGFSLKNRHFVT